MPCLSALVAEVSIIIKSGIFFITTLLDLTRQNFSEGNLSFNKNISNIFFANMKYHIKFDFFEIFQNLEN